jgi:HAD superfamily hydrolase (TIGR01549 family)
MTTVGFACKIHPRHFFYDTFVIMIKALIFDFGQTLVDSADGFRAAEKKAKSLIFEDLDSEPGGPSWDAFLLCYRRFRKEFHQRSNFSRPVIWQAVYAYFSRKPDLKKLEKWENDYWEQVKTRTNPFPETIQVLKELAERYQLALVTNTQGQKTTTHHRIALFPQLERFFKVIIVAGESRVPPKPDLEAFRLCLQKLKVLAHEAVFVGDDWRIDVCGARNAGIRPVWLQHHSVKRNWPDVTVQVPIIDRLDQLLDLESLSL